MELQVNHGDSDRLFVWIAFRNKPAIDGGGIFIRFLRFVNLGRSDVTRLLRPALMHSGQTPFGAAPGSTDGFAAHQNKNGISVRGRQNPDCHPTAFADGRLKRNVMNRTIGRNFLPSLPLSH